jgi:DNA-binding transcriptional LysR family regulator
VLSPYREVVIREFQAHKVPLRMDVEMPTVETIRKLVQSNAGVAFLPRMCVEQEIEQRLLCEVRVKEITWSARFGWSTPRGGRSVTRAGVSGIAGPYHSWVAISSTPAR